ncbi:MAG: NAD(P)/FAD-dependent oxidoreductase [Candidatus Altarchaeum sp.]|nr:NAD(P)/FAD-dependent oxidoreductase [Candidatus Altarchaeum sp.]
MYYDVVIVGAGPGGAIAAKTLDDSNLSVCLIDAKPRENIGEKVCGDAVGKEFFDFLHKKINLEYPDEEVKDRIDGIKVFSPDRKTVFDVETKEGGYMLDRPKFGQHLLRQIKKVNLMDNTKFVNFYEKGIIVKRSNLEKIKCSIVIDASGFNAVVRKKIDDNNNAPLLMEKNIAQNDIAICYREIKKYNFEDPHHCHIYLSSKFSPGGYVWEFPEGEHLNVGLGVLYPSVPKKQYDNYVKFRGEKFLNSEIIDAGGGINSTRRPIDSLVDVHKGIGIMLVGDAACQVNPIHGGGIGQAMRAGYFAGMAIKKIYERNDKDGIGKISLNDLWEYNSYYMQNYGGTIASLDLFRIFLQNLSDEEVNSGMSSGMIKEEDLIKISEGEEINLSIAEKIMRLSRGLSALSTAKKLAYTVKKMKEIKEMYKNYPSPKKFFKWKENVERIYEDLRKHI